VLGKLRARLAPLLSSLGRGAARISPNPSHWTAAGLVLSLFSGVFFALGNQTLGGALLLSSGAMDVVDGAVARAAGRVSRAGAFLDSVVDRAAEAAVFAGVAAGSLARPWLVVLALAFSMMVSYSRARLESLSDERPRGLELGERAERLLVLAVASLAGFTETGVLLVLLLAAETLAERTYLYYRSLAGLTHT
jgi:archaetidylinositol phosphate synthase